MSELDIQLGEIADQLASVCGSDPQTTLDRLRELAAKLTSETSYRVPESIKRVRDGVTEYIVPELDRYYRIMRPDGWRKKFEQWPWKEQTP